MLAELLRIIKGGKTCYPPGAKHAGRDHQRASAGAATHFVDPGHRPQTTTMQRGLQGAHSPQTPRFTDHRPRWPGLGHIPAMATDLAGDSPNAQHPNATAATRSTWPYR
ncbi:Uncharacterised protein [Mycobacterium tuberculosis]|nr:Uncharacterised protein [Mycobacterium tuberculosis]